LTLRGALLSFRIQRFETVVIVGATVLSVVVSAIVIAMFNNGGYARCQSDDPAVFTSFCQAGIFPWLNRIARLSASIVPIFPLVAGLMAGGPIVARELETGTARLAWSLGPSRTRWLAQRALPILALVAVAALAIGLTANALTHMLQPDVDLDQSFVGFRSRGLLIAVEALLVAAITFSLGAILGRSAPALVLSLVLAGGLTIAIDRVERTMLTSEAVVTGADGYGYDSANFVLDNRLRFADGSILTWDEAIAQHPELQNGWDESTGPRGVVLYIPGSRYHEVETREALVLGGVALAFGALGTLAVLRRRPR
jgi:hypothetical protein